jgi:hypothetical protein
MKTTLTSATSIKLRFSNAVHKMLEPNLGVKRSQRWREKKVNLTDAQKLAKYEEIVKLHNEISEEYTKCLFERREKRRVEKARKERGYVAKKRTKKEFESQ